MGERRREAGKGGYFRNGGARYNRRRENVRALWGAATFSAALGSGRGGRFDGGARSGGPAFRKADADVSTRRFDSTFRLDVSTRRFGGGRARFVFIRSRPFATKGAGLVAFSFVKFARLI